MDNLEAKIVEHIREHGPSKGSEIARVLNPSHQGPVTGPPPCPVWSRINVLVRRMANRGELVNLGNGSYDLPDRRVGNGDWRAQVVARLQSLTPVGFERMVGRLLEAEGVTDVEVTVQSGDGGIDGSGTIAEGLGAVPVFFQAKRWAGTVGPKEVRDFKGALQDRGHVGMIFATAGFTKEARAEAERTQPVSIQLIDGRMMAECMKRHRFGVSVVERMVEDVEVDADWWDGLGDDA